LNIANIYINLQNQAETQPFSKKKLKTAEFLPNFTIIFVVLPLSVADHHEDEFFIFISH